MMRATAIIFAVAMLTIFTNLCWAAGTKFNPYTGQWEVAPENATPQFNPYSGQFEMASPGSTPQYNSYQGSWQMAPQELLNKVQPLYGTMGSGGAGS